MKNRARAGDGCPLVWSHRRWLVHSCSPRTSAACAALTWPFSVFPRFAAIAGPEATNLEVVVRRSNGSTRPIDTGLRPQALRDSYKRTSRIGAPRRARRHLRATRSTSHLATHCRSSRSPVPLRPKIAMRTARAHAIGGAAWVSVGGGNGGSAREARSGEEGKSRPFCPVAGALLHQPALRLPASSRPVRGRRGGRPASVWLAHRELAVMAAPPFNGRLRCG